MPKLLYDVVVRDQSGAAVFRSLTADGERLNKQLDLLNGKKIDIKGKVDVDTSSATSAVSALAQGAGSATASLLRIGSTGAVIAGSIVPAAGAALAALAALAQVGGALVAGLGVSLLAFKGVGAAVKAMDTQQAAAGKTASQLAGQQLSLASAADAVKSAQQGVTDAVRAAADAQRAAAERVSQAEDNLAAAQQSARNAQAALTDARKAATRQLEDMRNAVSDSTLSERSATLGLAEARQRLAQVEGDSKSTALDRQRAILDVDEATQRLREQQTETRRLRTDQSAAAKAGVAGSAQVLAVQDQISASRIKVADAEKALADARTEQGRSATDSAERIAKAQQGVVAALRGVQQAQLSMADTGITSASALQTAMAQLSPAAQTFAKFIHDTVKPALADLSGAAAAGLFPKLQQSFAILLPMLPAVAGFVGDIGSAVGDIAIQVARAFGTPVWQNLFAYLGKTAVPTLHTLADTALTLGGTLGRLLVAFEPLSTIIVGSLGRSVAALDKFIAGLAETGQLQDFVKETTGLFQAFGPVVSVVLRTFGGLLAELSPVAFQFFRGLADVLVSLGPSLETLGRTLGTSLGVILQQVGAALAILLPSLPPLVTAFAAILVAVSPLLPVLAQLAVVLINALAKGLSAAAPHIEAFAVSLSAKIGPAIDKVSAWVHGTLIPGVAAMVNAFSTGAAGVDSSGFVGVMSKIGAAVHDLGPKLHDLFAGDGSGDAGKSFSDLADAGSQLWPVIKDLAGTLPDLSDSLSVGATIVRYFADHIDTLTKYMPVIIGAFVAYKLAQLAANVAALLSIPAKFAEIIVNRQLTKSNRELILSRQSSVVATAESTVATEASTVATAVNEGATKRSRAATILNTITQKAAALASKIWAAATYILGGAMRFAMGPFGLIIAVVALLVVGFVLAYKKSETFRDIVHGVLKGLKTAFDVWWTAVKGVFDFFKGALKLAWLAVQTVVGLITGHWDKLKELTKTAFRILIDMVLGVFDTMLKAAAKGLGWVPGIGGKLKNASKEFSDFRDRTNKALGGITDQKITVEAALSNLKNSGLDQSTVIPGRGVNGTPRRKADGGYISGPGGGRTDGIPIWASHGEMVMNAPATARNRVALESMNRRGYADGGLIVQSRLPGGPATSRWTSGIAAAAVASLGSSVMQLFGGTGTGGGGALPPGSAVQRWAPLVLQVLAMLSQPASLLGAVLRRIKFESGGRPDAINLTDINAQQGHPSQGLMQTIPTTFAANAGPFAGRGITDPLANIYAGLHYALGRYGSISAIDPLVRPRGYDSGGMLEPGLTLAYNGTGRPERVLGPGEGGGLTVNVSVNGAVGDRKAVIAWVRQGIREGLRAEGKATAARNV